VTVYQQLSPNLEGKKVDDINAEGTGNGCVDAVHCIKESATDVSNETDPFWVDGGGASILDDLKEGGEECDEECAWAPGSPTGRQGSDLVAAKKARQRLRDAVAPSKWGSEGITVGGVGLEGLGHVEDGICARKTKDD